MNIKNHIIAKLQKENSQNTVGIEKFSVEDILSGGSLNIILEQILLDCEDGVDNNLVALLKNKTSLFYVILDRPSMFAKKHTNILNHIIEHRNFSLLTALINAGLTNILRDVFEKTQYNILYTDYPNAFLEDEKNLVENIKQNNEWDALLSFLIKKEILPESKIEKFSWAILNKPNSLRSAVEQNYFKKPHDQYWSSGLCKNNSSWVMIDFINSCLMNQVEEFKIFCEKDFNENGLSDIAHLNNKDCYYLPDFLIFHDLAVDLKSLMNINHVQIKNWFKKRTLKVKKSDLVQRIYHILSEYDWNKNWNSIHLQYINPWHFISKNELLLTSNKGSDLMEINSLDYALLCQSKSCYDLIYNLAGGESLLRDELDGSTPLVIKNFLLHQKLNETLSDKKLINKIVKI